MKGFHTLILRLLIDWMRFTLLAFICSLGLSAGAQQLSVPDLFSMLDWSYLRMDTTLKKKGYLLLQKDVDSSSTIYQYSHLERNENKPTTTRSLVCMDVKAGELRSRLINYRTYSQEEFVGIARWLLENAYHTKDKFDFDDQKHTLYTNGKETIRVKVITTKIDKDLVFTSWELEIGK